MLNTIEAGFLEKVDENALALKLHAVSLAVEQQYRIGVLYDDVLFGEYFADLLVEDVPRLEQTGANGLGAALEHLRESAFICDNELRPKRRDHQREITRYQPACRPGRQTAPGNRARRNWPPTPVC